ncbi:MULTISPECIES: response regulator [unclassified Leptospira]|uniref:ATP-binding response regulator n=1 Tax=unclassified Leptospira TaxID=2633828 RepID=UPI0002BD3B93|nr:MULTISPECIES: response regulator [unclassified Leptospira]EMJ98579.1 response regulator receiver domain protein [Leptospira sp. B5-022]MCR1794770.1 response regulator [Leptospira sp. id769339]
MALRLNLHNPILIIEDQEENRELIARLARSFGVEADTAPDGKIGSEMAEKADYSLYLVDLEMPVMNGFDFIKKIQEKKPESLFIVISGNDVPEIIIEVMKLGIFDYLIKPINRERLYQVLNRISEFIRLKESERILIQENEERLKAQLNWILYKQSWLTDLEKNVDLSKSTLNNLKQSFFSGGGFGAIVSIVEMLQASAKREESGYNFSSDVIELLFENTFYVKKGLSSLEKSLSILNKDFQNSLRKTNSSEIYDLLEKSRLHLENSNQQYREKKNVFIPQITPPPNGFNLDVDADSLSRIFSELLVNSLKYSSNNSVINIYLSVSGGYLNINLKNEFDLRSVPGIPKNKELLVKQPFYRLAGFVDETLEGEEYFTGLGLTIVDFVIKKHGGIFSIHNVLDHSIGEKPVEVVLATVSLPIKN